MRFGSFLPALTLLLGLSHQALAYNLSAPTPPRAPGEPGTLGIAPWGLYANLIHNDSFSHTDKLLTHSARVGFLGRKDVTESHNIDLAWRVVNPSFKPKFGDKPHEELIGCFADWLELSVGRARVGSLGNYTFQAAWHLGVSHFGNKGARRIQVAVHNLMNTTTDHLTFTDQPKGFYGNGGFEAGFFIPSRSIEFSPGLYVGSGARISEVMNEHYIRALYTGFVFSDNYRFATELKIARQIRSRFLGPTKTFRWEYAIGIAIYKRYRPTVSYLSDYLRGDNVGQFYIDFLNFSVPL